MQKDERQLHVFREMLGCSDLLAVGIALTYSWSSSVSNRAAAPYERQLVHKIAVVDHKKMSLGVSRQRTLTISCPRAIVL